jgi:glycosyltransferase involved in cell wall biosynthesis
MNTNIALVIFKDGEYKILPRSALHNFRDLYSERIQKELNIPGIISRKALKLMHNILLPIKLKMKKTLPNLAAKISPKFPVLKIINDSLRRVWVPKGTVSFNPTNARILLIDLVLYPDHIEYLKKIALNHGADLTFLSYDCNPLITPQYWPENFSVDFSNYISLVNYSKRVWSISRTAQEDIKRFTKADESEMSFAFRWLAPTDFSECKHQNIIFPSLENEEYMLMVGSYTPNKNHLGLLESLKILHSKGLSVPQLYLAGAASAISEEIDSKIRELAQLGIQVKRCFNIENCCLGKLYKNSLFTILPSFIEGFGLPIVESLSFGKPVVTSTSTIMGELLTLPGTIGFNHQEEPSLATVLGRLLTEKELLNDLTLEAEKNSSNLGSWHEYAEPLYDFATRNNPSYGKKSA